MVGGGKDHPPPAKHPHHHEEAPHAPAPEHPAVSLPGILKVHSRFELKKCDNDHIWLSASVFLEDQLYFAHVLHHSGDLILVSASDRVSSGSSSTWTWSLRSVPWFNEHAKRITAVAFDPLSTMLYLGAPNGSVWELNVHGVFHPESILPAQSQPSSSSSAASSGHTHGRHDPLLRLVCHLPGIPVTALLVYSPKHSSSPTPSSTHSNSGKLVLVTSNIGSKLVLLADLSPPVVITFNSPIISALLFTSPKTGLTSLLVSLESGQNVTTVLDDMDLPTTTPLSIISAPADTKSQSSHHQHHHSTHHQQAKSIFRKAKDNLMSRITSSSSAESDKVSRKVNASTAGSTISSSGVKFTTIDDVNCKGQLVKIPNSKQFARHAHNKLDLFDEDFRQTSTIFASFAHSSSETPSFTPISDKVFAFYSNTVIVLYVILNGTLKELTRVHPPQKQEQQHRHYKPHHDKHNKKKGKTPPPHPHIFHHPPQKILSIVPLYFPDSSHFPPHLFVTTPSGLCELTLFRPPLPLCVDLLLSESPTSAQLLDVACTALDVAKHDVYVLAGDTRSIQGKFSKTIIYYKLAGLSYATITYKFGSRCQIPAMLFFFELVDQERAKIPHADKIKISHIALIARIEQFLRVTTPSQILSSASSSGAKQKQSMRSLLKKMIMNNINFSTDTAVDLLTRSPLLLWALRALTLARMCQPYTIQSIYVHRKLLEPATPTKAFWRLVLSWNDWLSLWSCSPSFFYYFSALVTRNLPHLHPQILSRLLTILAPWRPELNNLIHTHLHKTSDQDTVIDFASEDSTTVSVPDILTLFISALVEATRRHYNDHVVHIEQLIAIGDHYEQQRNVSTVPSTATQKESVVSTLLLSYSRAFTRSLSASATHVLVVRNSNKLLTWGENKLGCLGIKDSSANSTYSRPIVDTPTPVDLPPSLKISVTSVAAGHHHNIAITAQGTLLVWGSNRQGQLGLPEKTILFASRPVPLAVFSSNRRPVRFMCISAGSYHTAAIDTNHTLWTWGWGIHGQLGNNDVESTHIPTPINVNDELCVYVSCGHSHTAVLTSTGSVYTFGCNHFGQLGLNTKEHKLKVPSLVTIPQYHNQQPIVRLVEAGTTATVMVTTKNRLYYAGLNPASLKSIINSSRSTRSKVATTNAANAAHNAQQDEYARTAAASLASAAGPNHQPTKHYSVYNKKDENPHEEEAPRDYTDPIHIDTAHMAGDISKVSVGSTHFVLLSSLGYVYTWGMGKSGQLVRPDDESKTLELIDHTQEIDEVTHVLSMRMIIANDIAAAADCTFIVEKDSGTLFACGFNSNGQLGKLESEDEASVMTVKTKKRVVRIRQPSNIHFKLKSIHGIPKQTTYVLSNTPSSTISSQVTSEKQEGDDESLPPLPPPPKSLSDASTPEELLQWTLKHYHGLYNQHAVLHRCVASGNGTISSASLIEELAENHEEALRHKLSLNDGNHEEHVDNYIAAVNQPNDNRALRLLTLLVSFWSSSNLPPSSLEDLLDRHRVRESSWASHINSAIRTTIISSDSSTAKWISANLTPIFILSSISQHNNSILLQPLPLISSSSSDESPHDFDNSNNNKLITPTSPSSLPILVHSTSPTASTTSP